jgi:hypothetical protein
MYYMGNITHICVVFGYQARPRVFDPCTSKTKEKKISIFFFSDNHAALKGKNTILLVLSRDNVPDCSDMFTSG